MNLQENGDFSDGNVSDVNTGVEVRWKKVDSPKGWTTEMRRYYNKPCKRQRHFDWKKVVSDIRQNCSASWHILEEDLYPINYIKRRCRICRQVDHLEITCPRRKAKCSMCGIPGHTDYRCPQKMCLNCGERNQDFVDNCRKCRSLFRIKCPRCSSYGHDSRNCPDLWRRFHCTTEFQEINTAPVEVNKNIQCCNCAQSGHFFEDCKKPYWTKYLPTSNFVKDYAGLSLDDNKTVTGSGSSRINSNWFAYKAEEKIPYKRPRLECNTSEDEVTELPTTSARRYNGNTNNKKGTTYHGDRTCFNNPFNNCFQMLMKKKRKKKKKKKDKNNDLFTSE